jgi:hypothetical protein
VSCFPSGGAACAAVNTAAADGLLPAQNGTGSASAISPNGGTSRCCTARDGWRWNLFLGMLTGIAFVVINVVG